MTETIVFDPDGSHAVNLLGPPPPSVTAIGASGLLLWLFPVWGWWFDRHRDPHDRRAKP